jgi:pectin methylesterase-like acyl-CoA thioesterase
VRVTIALVVGLMLAGCASGKTTVSTVTVTVQKPPKTAAPGAQDTTYFGQIASVTKADAKRFLIVVRPQLYLVGVTANVVGAAQKGTQCAPLACPGVDDDRIVIPAGSQELTFVLPARASGTVLTGVGSDGTTTVSGAQLAALVGGAKTPHLTESLVSGVWLAVSVDTVTSFAQQFQP